MDNYNFVVRHKLPFACCFSMRLNVPTRLKLQQNYGCVSNIIDKSLIHALSFQRERTILVKV